MATIAVFNPRDGVGKTTTALSLLAAIGRRGRRPFAIDLDPKADLSRHLGLHPEAAEETVHGFFVRERPLGDIAVITRSGVALCAAHPELAMLNASLGKSVQVVTRLRTALRGVDRQEEPVILDCGDSLDVLSLNAIFAADLTLVPVAPGERALPGALEVERALNALEPVFKHRLPRRYVLTRITADAEGETIAARAAASLRPDDICATRIGETPEREAVRDVFRHAPEGAGAGDYAALLDELVGAGFLD